MQNKPLPLVLIKLTNTLSFYIHVRISGVTSDEHLFSKTRFTRTFSGDLLIYLLATKLYESVFGHKHKFSDIPVHVVCNRAVCEGEMSAKFQRSNCR